MVSIIHGFVCFSAYPYPKSETKNFKPLKSDTESESKPWFQSIAGSLVLFLSLHLPDGLVLG